MFIFVHSNVIRIQSCLSVFTQAHSCHLLLHIIHSLFICVHPSFFCVHSFSICVESFSISIYPYLLFIFTSVSSVFAHTHSHSFAFIHPQFAFTFFSLDQIKNVRPLICTENECICQNAKLIGQHCKLIHVMAILLVSTLKMADCGFKSIKHERLMQDCFYVKVVTEEAVTYLSNRYIALPKAAPPQVCFQ